MYDLFSPQPPAPVAEPPKPVVKNPIPSEHLILQTIFDQLVKSCLQNAANAVSTNILLLFIWLKIFNFLTLLAIFLNQFYRTIGNWELNELRSWQFELQRLAPFFQLRMCSEGKVTVHSSFRANKGLKLTTYVTHDMLKKNLDNRKTAYTSIRQIESRES